MVKKPIKISIDEKILQRAKNEIPNISEFVETTLKNYFNTPTKSLIELEYEKSELIKQIHENQAKIGLINKIIQEENITQEPNNENKNEIWRKLWSKYYKTETYSKEDLSKATIILEKSKEELIKILDELYYTKLDYSKSLDWDYCLKLLEDL